MNFIGAQEKSIEKLWRSANIKEMLQKYSAAEKQYQEIYKLAITQKNEEYQTNALIKIVLLQRGLSKVETAVKFLANAKWPSGNKERALLHLFYANTLYDYYRHYSWEIRRREKVMSQKEIDLKKWTARDIFLEINKQYALAYTYKDELGKLFVKDYTGYIKRNGYPAHIRSTMRDFIVYGWCEFLANTTTWTPVELKEKYLLDFHRYIKLPGTRKEVEDNFFLQTKIHPIEKVVYLLDRLYTWHKKNKRKASALESQLERIRKLLAVFNKISQTKKYLKELINQYETIQWWAIGQYQYAKMTEREGKLVEAHKEAQAGYKKYPKSLGGKKCFYMLKRLEAPSFSLQSMTVDKNKTRSIQITHKNLKKLYFRAYFVDVKEWLTSKSRYFGSMYASEMRSYMKQTPAVKWTQQLEYIKDYRDHITYSIPPIEKKGIFVILASAKEDFTFKNNKVIGNYILLSDYALLRTSKDGSWKIKVVHGTTGKPVHGAIVKLFTKRYRKEASLITAKRTKKDGSVFFPYKRNMSSCIAIAEKNGQVTFDNSSLYFHRSYRRDYISKGCFIYTDRSIYRPLQKLYFKIVTFSGYRKNGIYQCIPNTKGTITFSDANGKEIKKIQITTNKFGTASGEFFIPKGRILGRYPLRCKIRNASGYTNVRVEEYKRPTFEAELLKPKKSLKLNENISVTGKAKYYFGLPVSKGKVIYRVLRTPVYPWWWYYYSHSAPYQITSGKTTLQPDGTFQVNFIPKADPSLAKNKYISYNFKVEVDITDEGGETRSTTTSYPIGFVAVKASFHTPYNFYLENEKTTLNLKRTDLSGVGKAGMAHYKLFTLKQPKECLTPNTIPTQLQEGKEYTKGDKIQPRWIGDQNIRKYFAQYKKGKLYQEGKIQHDISGSAKLDLGKLSPGVYRIFYTTKDIWGSTYKAQKDIIVAGENMKIAIPFLLMTRKRHVKVGENATFLYGSGLRKANYTLGIYQNKKQLKNITIDEKGGIFLFNYPVENIHRGGFTLILTGFHDYRIYNKKQNIYVPWDNKQLKITFNTFRNLLRPGQKESWTVTISGAKSEKVAAELLAYMYDKSLDFFVPHSYRGPAELYPSKFSTPYIYCNIGSRYYSYIHNNLVSLPSNPYYSSDRFIVFDRYPIGGLGRRRYSKRYSRRRYRNGDPFTAERKELEEAPALSMMKKADKKPMAPAGNGKIQKSSPQKTKQTKVRSNFSETAFFQPHLTTDKEGKVKITFEVPDSVTSWKVYLHAITKDLHFMTTQKQVVTRKDMMVRPYMPRFLREGDEALLKVVINNATKKELKGKVSLVILDPKTKKDQSLLFGVNSKKIKSWKANAHMGANVTWKIKAPHNLGSYAFKVIAKTEHFSDGELRPIPVLPSRIHLIQSKFVTLKDNDKRTLFIKDLANSDKDKTLIHQSLVVTLNAQLIYTVLKALPYLVDYPYECVEQTLNRFLSTGIVSSLYNQYPAIKKMANVFSQRKTRLDGWNKGDANRKMALEETPWLSQAHGGSQKPDNLINVLDAEIAKLHRDAALEKLRKAQLSDGSFPWWSGGPASPYMTLYLVHGFAKAKEFNVSIPKRMVRRAFVYLVNYYREHYSPKLFKKHYGYSFITFLNYVLSCYRDKDYYEGAFTEKERKEMLAYSFKYWKKQSPYLKAYLSLTLKRMGRDNDAKMVLDSIMDSAITKKDQGTFWAPEDRGWLWYNDTTESHAFILRALQEVKPEDKKHIDGLVLWLLLNKKMNQWKSTRTTAEVIYSLVYTMHKQKSLAVRESAKVTMGQLKKSFVFEPDEYTGGNTQIVVKGKAVKKEMAKTEVEKTGKGYMFASLTWHYSTETLPKDARGDFLAVTRKYYLRALEGTEYVLRPLSEGTKIKVGDQIEVHLSIRSKHPMEYIHLRDPRGAGFEPMKNISRHYWDLGIYWYQETKDSGTNFFFENLPQGEYNFKYRLRATMSGKFRIGPATIQSMYSPDFAGFSSGKLLDIK